ncbi:MAG: Nramp family divalent metal transporter [Clostridiales bacterium]|nr:Nramp family divalent metal transporter [Clostridiales bacterium]
MKPVKNGKLRNIILFLSVLGPGLITANADNDAGGIATYAQVGAAYGYKLLWSLILITISLGIVQEMCSRMGAVTGKGLSDLIREQFGVKLTLFAMVTLLIANITNIIADFAGIAASADLLLPGNIMGIPAKFIVVPLVAFFLWMLIIKGNYKQVEKAFLLLTLVFISYVISGVALKPDWGLILKSTFVPTFDFKDSKFILLFIGTIGTTITPWMQFFLQSSVVDKGINIKNYKYEKAEVLFGAFITDFISFFIIVSTAAVIYYRVGPREIQTAGDAAIALKPLAGNYASLLFAVGLFGASVLAASVLPLSTSYAICEAFGWESGIDKKWNEAPVFFGLYTALIAAGAGIVLLPKINLIKIMLISQEVNGILLPVILVYMLKLINNKELMGEYVNSKGYNIVAWTTVIFVIALTLLLLFVSIGQLLKW